MPRHPSPKIHKLVLYNVVIFLDDDGNRTDENRPSKKDPRKRKNKINLKLSKHLTEMKKIANFFENSKFKNNENESDHNLCNSNDTLENNSNENNDFLQSFMNFEYDQAFDDDFDYSLIENESESQ